MNDPLLKFAVVALAAAVLAGFLAQAANPSAPVLAPSSVILIPPRAHGE